MSRPASLGNSGVWVSKLRIQCSSTEAIPKHNTGLASTIKAGARMAYLDSKHPENPKTLSIFKRLAFGGPLLSAWSNPDTGRFRVWVAKSSETNHGKPAKQSTVRRWSPTAIPIPCTQLVHVECNSMHADHVILILHRYKYLSLRLTLVAPIWRTGIPTQKSSTKTLKKLQESELRLRIHSPVCQTHHCKCPLRLKTTFATLQAKPSLTRRPVCRLDGRLCTQSESRGFQGVQCSLHVVTSATNSEDLFGSIFSAVAPPLKGAVRHPSKILVVGGHGLLLSRTAKRRCTFVQNARKPTTTTQ